MKRVLFFILFTVILLIMYIACDNPVREYYSNLSIENNSKHEVSEIEVSTWINWYGLEDDDKITYEYNNLSIGEKSEYQDVRTAVIISTNRIYMNFIVILNINYNVNGVSQSVTIFDDGLAGSYVGDYYDLTDEELEKVYLKKDTNNTLVITDTGVELLQGE